MNDKSELVVRKANAADAAALLALLATLKTESTTFEVTGPTVDEATQAQQINQISQSQVQVLLVATIDDQIIGLATILPTHDASIGEVGVAVLKAYWHRGIGTELMYSALDWAAESSAYTVITLTVQNVNQFAKQLYDRIGFTTIRELTVKNSAGQEVAAVEMQLAVK